AGAISALVHLAAAAEVAGLRVLRRAERAGVEAVAATNAEVLGVQDHAVVGLVEAIDRADRGAGRVGAVHARHRDRALTGLAVVDSDDAAAIDAPRHLVGVLACGRARVALDAAVRIAKEFHAGHGGFPPLGLLDGFDLAQRAFRFLHVRDRVEAIGGKLIDRFAEDHRIGALGVFRPQVRALPPAREVERHPGDALSDALGDQRLDLGPGAVLRARHPHPVAVLEAAGGGIADVDLDEHVLLQLGEPLVGPGLFAAALEFDEAARGEDDRELLRDSFPDRAVLYALAEMRQPIGAP